MIDKVTFCEVIELLKQQIHVDTVSADSISEMFGVVQKIRYNNKNAIDAIMLLLRIYFPKKDDFCKIEFYCFILDFGKDGNTFMTPEELYDSLIQDL